MKSFKLLILICICTSALQGVSAQSRQTKEEYIARYRHIAIAGMERYGIPASITMAQGILESDCGNSVLSRKSNNHFGIKCKKNWTGDRVYHDDDAKGECFRAYPSVEASYQDHAEFLDANQRYDILFTYSTDDYVSWAKGLKACGYATAPDYAERLIKIIEDNNLQALDKPQAETPTHPQHVKDQAATWFEDNTIPQSASNTDPNAFRVTINAHEGYNVYRTNNTCYVLAKHDDTFARIARIFEMSESTLRSFNDRNSKEALQEGEIVFIEKKKSRWEGNTMHHTVREGETLYSLSQSYGIRLKSLRKLNRMKSGQEFSQGQVIRLK